MIISASRRTDIPAFYSEWFMNRIRAGWCLVPNPLNMNQISHISLDPLDVDAIVFWSKNPKPMLRYLDELNDRGFRYYFQVTVTAYGHKLEPRIPSLSVRLQTFKMLSQRLGAQKVVWRYDPIIISNKTPIEYHVEKFESIASKFRGRTRRVVISFCDFYKKTDRQLSRLENEGYIFDRKAHLSVVGYRLLNELSVIARKNDMQIFSCAEEHDYMKYGVSPGSCIDCQLINSIWALDLNYRKDPYQRKPCLCTVSKDIGVNDTCMHGCVYCYATRNYTVARKRFHEHDPNSPILWQNPKATLKTSDFEYKRPRLL